MQRFTFRSALIGISLAASLLGASPAAALNEVIESSCDPDCATKPPKQALFVRQIGDLGPSGEIVPMTGTLAKGAKKTVLKIDLTFEWFTLSAQFRPLTVKVNNKFPVNFLLLTHLDSCPSGECLRHATVWFDIDKQESVYPGQFYGQPLTITVTSAKAADAGVQYIASFAAQIVKKK